MNAFTKHKTALTKDASIKNFRPIDCFNKSYMKNTIGNYLNAFLAISLTSGTIWAQQSPLNMTRPNNLTASRNVLAAAQSKSLQAMSQNKTAAQAKASATITEVKAVATSFSVQKEIVGSKASQQMAPKKTDGGADAGGGIFYKDDQGQIKTLADAGYVFRQVEEMVAAVPKSEVNYYVVSKETKEALKSILKTLGTYSDTYKDILNPDDRSMLIDQDKVDLTTYENIKLDYMVVLRKAGYRVNLDDGHFILPAYSKDKKTYILPDFKLLSPYQQALNLIHEKTMRSGDHDVNIRLTAALIADTIIYDYLKSAKTEEDSIAYHRAFTRLNLACSLDCALPKIFDYSIVEKYDKKMRLNVFATLEQKLQRPVLASELFLQPQKLSDSLLKMDTSLTKNLDSIAPVTESFGRFSFIEDRDWSIEHYNSNGDSTYIEWVTNKIRNKRMEGWLGIPKTSIPEEQAKNLVKTFSSICEKFSDVAANSDVPGDRLVHVDAATQELYLINCNWTNNSGWGKSKGFGSLLFHARYGSN